MSHAVTHTILIEVSATLMKRKVYQEIRGWETLTQSVGDVEGYLVETFGRQFPNCKGYEGYVSWVDREDFSTNYRAVTF